MKVTKNYALNKLSRAIDAIEAMRQMRYDHPEFDKWRRYTLASIARIFGKESPNAPNFQYIPYRPSIIQVGKTLPAEFQEAYVEGLGIAKARLESMIVEVNEYWDDDITNSTPVFLPDDLGGFWQLIHPVINSVSRSRFESGHFADSVESAFKEINSIIKSKVNDAVGIEYDGANLMNRAFSAQNPVLWLDDLTTETGRNIQQGYMQLFAGSMIGIRNPKAHSNINIDKVRAIHLLFLASLLMHKYDEAI